MTHSEEARRQQSGIAGEPIPLDSKDPKYHHAYLDLVQQNVKNKWVYSCVRTTSQAPCEPAKLVIEFGILDDGRVPFVIVRTPSEFDIHNTHAVQAVTLASPFPPVPPELMARMKPESTGILLRMIFHYALVGVYERRR